MVKIADSEITVRKIAVSNKANQRPMLKRALFIGNQLGLVFVYMSVESDIKKFWIGFK